jgi:dTDP-4-amino-4,6-dideoxygalactose transaminase
MTVPFLDLRAQYRSIREEVLENAQFVLGPEVEAFEREFAAYSGAEFGVGMNSGTSALHLALLAAGVGPGDEVITTPLTFVASVAAITYAGARPVLVDVDPVSYTLDPSLIEKVVSPRTRALLPVHLYGQPADMGPICEIARRHKLLVIEDAAQAHGAQYHGRRCGSLGDVACFSFYPGKNLGAYGEGGMAVTSNKEFADRMKVLRDWGQTSKYHHVVRGFNARLEGIQGAVLRVKLRHLEEWTEARRRHAERYLRELRNLPGVTLQEPSRNRRHVYHIFPVLVDDRDGFMTFLAAEGIQSSVHYPFPVHTLPAYADLGYAAGDLPVAERIAATVVSLPMFAELTDEQTGRVIGAVRKWSQSAQ